MFNVIWELLDGNTQGESDQLFNSVEDAAAYLREKAVELNGLFNWIQIERIDS